MKRLHILLTTLVCLVFVFALRHYVARGVNYFSWRFGGRCSVEQRLEQYGPAARERLKPYFARAGVEYPPRRLTLVGLKSERRLLVYAPDAGSGWVCVRSYPIVAQCGTLGPKLRYGDGQVPEGIYRITFLNANSRYHLALRVGYPNAFDQAMGRRDHRDNLGGDIMIHGDCVSCGCLAMGDRASEDLFVLAADTGIANIKVILSPVDFRTRKMPEGRTLPPWTTQLYRRISSELAALPPGPGQ